MHIYSAFGLTVSSELIIPEFLPSEESPDVFFKFGSITPPEITLEGMVRAIEERGDGLLLYWSMLGSFLVERGELVTICPLPGTEEALIRLVLSGPVFGVLLYQRGLRVFHAGVIHDPINGGSVAFLARKGGGKSTMVGAMCGLGYALMSDDILALCPDRGKLLAQTGFPHTKLWGEAATALNQESRRLAESVPGFDKRGRSVEDAFFPHQAPLRLMCILEFGEDLRIDRLFGKEALMALLPHWYGALFDGQLLDFFGPGEHFLQCADIIRDVPVYRLTRPRSFDRLDEAAAMVHDFLQKPTGSP